MSGVAVAAHAGSVRTSGAEPASIFRNRRLGLRHHLSEVAAKAGFIVERGEEARAFFGIQLQARLVRLLLLDLLLEGQLGDYVQLDGVTNEDSSQGDVIVDGGTGVACGVEPRTEPVQDAGADLVETQSAERRQEVPVDCPAVVTRRFLREVRGDRGEVVGDELTEGRRFGRRSPSAARLRNSDQRRTASSYVAAFTVARFLSRPALPATYIEKCATPAASS